MADPRSGGLFLGMATHNADFLRWLTGANVTKVFAQANTFSDLEAARAERHGPARLRQRRDGPHVGLVGAPEPRAPRQRGPLPGGRPRRHHRPGELRVPRPRQGRQVGADQDPRAVRLPQGAEIAGPAATRTSGSSRSSWTASASGARPGSAGRKAGRPWRSARRASSRRGRGRRSTCRWRRAESAEGTGSGGAESCRPMRRTGGASRTPPPAVEDSCPLDLRDQTRNLGLFAACTGLIYLCAPGPVRGGDAGVTVQPRSGPRTRSPTCRPRLLRDDGDAGPGGLALAVRLRVEAEPRPLLRGHAAILGP